MIQIFDEESFAAELRWQGSKVGEYTHTYIRKRRQCQKEL